MKIAIIGCGNMGSSIAKQLARSHQLAIYDRFPEGISIQKDLPQIKICRDLQEAVNQSDLILLGIKPNDLPSIAEQLQTLNLPPHGILVSMLSGTSLKQLKEQLKIKNTIVRIMPNLAVEFGQGVIGIVEYPQLSSELKDHLTSLFSVMGLVVWLPEDKINALTALTGSGPAFILVFIESMIDAGIALGFKSAEAKDLILQTLIGAIAMMQNTKKTPGELRWQVSSPSGTTIAGEIALEEAGVRSGIIKTFLAAYNRAKELDLSH